MMGPLHQKNPQLKGLSSGYVNPMNPLDVMDLVNKIGYEWIRVIMEEMTSKNWYPGKTYYYL